jgi:glycosyltransferase involved in cell wall biosynthesis
MTSSRPKVVHLTSVHPPLDTRVFWKECRTLAKAGYEVVLIAPDPPVGEKDGVRFVGHPRPKSRLERVAQVPLRLLRLARRERAALYHFHDPDLLPVGVLLALWTRRPVVYDSHEDVPRQLLDRVWIPVALRPLASAAARLVERACVSALSGVISAEPGGLGRFRKREVVLVQNFPMVEEFPPSPVPYDERPNRVVYVGDITRSRGAEVMVRAMDLLPARVDAELVIAGKCEVPGLLEDLRRLPGWERVDYRGWQSRSEIRDILHGARVGLVLMQATAQYRDATQPVKLFEYMAAGLPVVASDFQAWREIVDGCGVLVDESSPAAAAAAIERLLTTPEEGRSMGDQGRESVLERWNWATEEPRLLELYGRLLHGGPAVQ